jgi:putative LysE/RhtB family amino acid efflux pump
MILTDVMTLMSAVLVGFVISIPLGPSGLLCIRETLGGGVLRGIAVGMGSAFAEGLCALAANLGLQKLDIIQYWGIWLKFLGGMVLIIFALKELKKLRQRTHDSIELPALSPSHIVYLGLFSAGFILIITNPLSIFALAGLIGAFHMKCDTPLRMALLGVGAFLGSLLWWTLVSTFVSTVKDQFSPKALYHLRQWSIYLLLGLGIGILSSLVLQDYLHLF